MSFWFCVNLSYKSFPTFGLSSHSAEMSNRSANLQCSFTSELSSTTEMKEKKYIERKDRFPHFSEALSSFSSFFNSWLSKAAVMPRSIRSFSLHAYRCSSTLYCGWSPFATLLYRAKNKIGSYTLCSRKGTSVFCTAAFSLVPFSGASTWEQKRGAKRCVFLVSRSISRDEKEKGGKRRQYVIQRL